MNAFQRFIKALPCYFVTHDKLPELIELHRLCLCCVRLGGPGGRFFAPAQNVAKLLEYCEAAGDYVRDVSIATSEIETAHDWRPEPKADHCRDCGTHYEKHNLCGCQYCPNCWLSCPRCGGRRRDSEQAPTKTVRLSESVMFNESDCGGAFDGRQVTSDADPGL